MSVRDPNELPPSPLVALEALEGSIQKGAGLFSGLDPDARAVLEAETEWTQLDGGAVLFREGDTADSVYVLFTGRLRVFVRSPSGEDTLVAEIGRGESVGEMALLTGAPRSATVVAVRDSVLVRLSRAAFERIVERSPRIILSVTRRLVERLQRTTHAQRAKATLTTIALIPLDPAIDAAQIGKSLLAAVAAAGSATLVTRDRAAAELSSSAWLDALEREFRYVLYAGDARDHAWTDRAMRQADCVLFVAPGDRAPDANAIAAAARHTHAQALRELMLLHPPPHAAPHGTARWLDMTAARAHYHVRVGVDGDLFRVGRMLTGRGVGLALGGGGARGFAHIGVIEALGEAGVPIDAIAGTSMGAVIAAQYAAGAQPAEMREINRRHWVRRNPLKDKTLPVVALLAGRRLERMIAEMFGETQIEDLWMPFFCVSADLTQAEMRVHARGSLGRAVRASMSLPGIAIPVHDSGSMLVDGGLMNNVPADILRGPCGKVVAVDVSPEKDLAITSPYPPAASGWRLLWGRRKSHLPGIGAILMRSVLLSSTRHQAAIAGDVDLFLHPRVEGFGMFEWPALDAIAEVGRACARDAIASSGVRLT
jgi:predicted acylesterase/phospholipase RssA/CRP-like cAMP-binding protein